MGIRVGTNHNPSPATRFKKGQPRPKGAGRKPLSAPEKELRTFTKETLSKIINELMEMEREDLKALRSDPKTNGVKALIARAIIWGDMAELERILARAIGPLPTKLEHGGPNGSHLPPPVINYFAVPPPNAT